MGFPARSAHRMLCPLPSVIAFPRFTRPSEQIDSPSRFIFGFQLSGSSQLRVPPRPQRRLSPPPDSPPDAPPDHTPPSSSPTFSMQRCLFLMSPSAPIHTPVAFPFFILPPVFVLGLGGIKSGMKTRSATAGTRSPGCLGPSCSGMDPGTSRGACEGVKSVMLQRGFWQLDANSAPTAKPWV